MSGCPRSLQVATFRASRRAAQSGSPVAPAVSKSLHSTRPRPSPRSWSGCPRSLQVATFPAGGRAGRRLVRLPPQSPSRYIPGRRALASARGPVAPAVSKSLHSNRLGDPKLLLSGCPRSLQVATFQVAARSPALEVRLPPQSPSRYIPGLVEGAAQRGPVAPAVSKSLHSYAWPLPCLSESGCPRSLQVATFRWPSGDR